jgi:hypothetical protein
MIRVPNEMLLSKARLAELFSTGTLDISRTLLASGTVYQIAHDDCTGLVDQGVSQ